jgi:ATP-dependent Clp protease protease subunit
MVKKIEDTEYNYKLNIYDHGIFILSDEITHANTTDAIEFILECNLLAKKDRFQNITLIINSPGGDLTAAFALIDIMQGSRIPVHTLGLGQVSSAGLLIFMAGKKGFRTLTPNTSILSHQFSWGSDGKEHELVAVIKEFTLTGKRMLNHYIKCTGMNEKKVKEVLMPSSDVYLDATEAVKYNIADKVVNTYLNK